MEFILGEKQHTDARFPGDTLESDSWEVLGDGKPVASIGNLAFKPQFNVSVSHLRMAGPMPLPLSMDAFKFHDSGPLPTLEAALEWTVVQCGRILEWRAAQASTK